jgi:hypothetical protein
MNGSPASPWPGRLAWTLAGLAIALQTGDAVFSLASDAVEPPVAADLIISAITLAFSAVGALVASRQPRNPIGWMSRPARRGAERGRARDLPTGACVAVVPGVGGMTTT